jgi:hypothetical protein
MIAKENPPSKKILAENPHKVEIPYKPQEQ